MVLTTSQLGTYTVLYYATDSSNNISETVFRTIVVEDQTHPVITILGDNPRTIEANTSEYIDLNTSIYDFGDPTITVSTNADAVITSQVGTYSCIYSIRLKW